MANLLTHTKTMRAVMKELLVKTEVAVVGLFLVVMLFYSVMQMKYERDLGRFLTLNQFYEDLDELNILLKQSVLGIDTLEKQNVIKLEKNMEKHLKELQEMGGTELLNRNLEDVKWMLREYQENLNVFMELSAHTEQGRVRGKELNQGYENMVQIYNSISREFKPLYSQLMEFIKSNEKEIKDTNRGYLAGFFIVILCFMIYEKVKIKKILSWMTEPVLLLADHVNSRNIEKIEMEGNTVEAEILIDSFNMMIMKMEDQMKQIQENADTKERLHLQKMENLEISNRLKQSELLALQRQINPHFLFNTLNMIVQTAYLENADRTIFLLDKTAKLLRYTLDCSGREVTLEREMEMLGNYVYIQEERFGKKIRFIFSLDETFHDIKIPSLILQPLVENAIIHGKGTRIETVEIRITTEYDAENDTGMICIIDNGNGIEAERLAEIRKEILFEDISEKRIGLQNVYTRLQIFFNRKAKMELYSEPGKGTEVRLILPYRKEAPEDV